MAVTPTALATRRIVTASGPPFSSRRIAAARTAVRVSLSFFIYTVYRKNYTLYRKSEKRLNGSRRITNTHHPLISSSPPKEPGHADSPLSQVRLLIPRPGAGLD